MKRLLIPVFALSIFCGAARAQNPTFRNPIYAPLFQNPAFAGSMDQQRIALVFTNRYFSLPFHEQVFYASYDQVSNRLKGAIGGEVLHYRIGSYSVHGGNQLHSRASLVYAPKFSLGSNWSLSPAIKLGYHRLAFDAIFSGYPLVTGPLRNHGIHLSPGFLINSPSFYFGVAADFLPAIAVMTKTEPGTDATLQPMRTWKFQSGYRFQPASARWSLSATGLLALEKVRYNVLFQLMYNRKWLLLGAGAERILGNGTPDYTSLGATAGFKHRLFRLMATFHYLNTNTVNTLSGTEVNLSLMLYLPKNNNQSSPENGNF